MRLASRRRKRLEKREIFDGTGFIAFAFSLRALRDLVLLLAIPSIFFLAISSIWLRLMSHSLTNNAFVFSMLLLASILRYDRASCGGIHQRPTN